MEEYINKLKVSYELLNNECKNEINNLVEISFNYDINPSYYKWQDNSIIPNYLFLNQYKKTIETFEKFHYENPKIFQEIIDNNKEKLYLFNHDREEISLISFFSEIFYFDLSKYIKPNFKKSKLICTVPLLQKKITDGCLIRIDNDIELKRSSLRFINIGLYYHQFLRRGFLFSPNWDFLNQFIKSYLNNNNNIYEIAVDPHRVALEPQIMSCDNKVEFDHWYGAKFNKDKLFISYDTVINGRYGPGENIGENSIIEFQLETRNNENILQIEEISDPTNENMKIGDYYLQRYIHSIIDLDTKKIKHLDGAVIIHNQKTLDEKYKEKNKFSFKNCKGIDYQKMFKIEGDIPISDWESLIINYFRGNPFIYEIFEKTDI